MLPDICNVARLKIVLAPGWAFFHPLFHRLPLSRGDRVFPRSLVLVGVVLKVMSIPDVSIPDVATWVLWVPSRRYSLSGWCDSRFFSTILACGRGARMGSHRAGCATE